MELLFFYCSDNRSVPPEGINFGGKYLLRYSEEKKLLTVEQNSFYIEGFFNSQKKQNADTANITNISAIVGQNGAGKSSVLITLTESLCRDLIGREKPIIVGLMEGSKFVIYYSDGLLQAPRDSKEIKFEVLKDKKVRLEEQISEQGNPDIIEIATIRAFEDIDFVFFSNIYDHSVEVASEGLKNISTNYLSGLPNKKTDVLNFSPASISDKDEFRFEEIRRQIEFINKFPFDELIPFELPSMIIVSLRDNPKIRVRSKNKNYEKGQPADIDDVLYKLFDQELKEIRDPSERLKFRFIGVAVLNFVSENEQKYSQYLELSHILNYFIHNPDTSFMKAVNYLLANIGLSEVFSVDNRKNLKETAGVVKNFFKQRAGQLALFIEMIQGLDLNEKNGVDADSFALFTDDNKFSFYDFYRIYSESYLDRPYLNFNWRNISSGEKALLTMYSRFYTLINESLMRKSGLVKNNMIVLLDEPDVFLHPSWQKKLIYNLKSFLARVFANDYHDKIRNIQIIFTSNNPLTITDLPHPNVVLLRRENGRLITSGFSDSKRTFSANIFDLYSDSFFMNEGFTGAFAIERINEVFNDLISEEPISQSRKLAIRKIIQMIGEPIVKNKLTEMYSLKEMLNGDIEERLNRLENRLFTDDSNKEE